MSRYIDADALIDRLDYCVKEGMGSTIAFTFKHMVEEAPTIDIVRCKECENWQTDWVPEGYEGVEDLHYCAVVDGCKFGDFFCADGERREP